MAKVMDHIVECDSGRKAKKVLKEKQKTEFSRERKGSREALISRFKEPLLSGL